MMMCRVVLIVVLSACVIEAQFRFPLLSQFLPSRSPLVPAGRTLFSPPPPPLLPPHGSGGRLALSPQQTDAIGLTAPPPRQPPPSPPSPQDLFHASPKLEDGPLRVLEVVGSDEGIRPAFRGFVDAGNSGSHKGRDLLPEESTLTPFVATPTTLRFTLDDVPEFLEPSIFPTKSNADFIKSSLEEEEEDTLSIVDNPLDDDTQEVEEEDFSLPLPGEDPPKHLFILTSTENTPDSATLRPSTPFSMIESTPRAQPSSILQGSDSSFRPSFSLPFLDQSTSEQKNLFTIVETRNPRVSSFLRSEAPHLLDSIPKTFALKPVKVGEADDLVREHVTQDIQDLKLNRSLSKTPVPKPIVFSEEEDDDTHENIPVTVTKVVKTQSTEKPFHFEREFLSLLKKNAPVEKLRPEKTESSFKPNPFWFSEQNEGSSGVWQLKGGVRRPSLDLVSQDSVISPVTFQNNLGGFFATSIRGLTSTTQKSEESLKILDDGFDDSVTTEGITVKSLAQEGLSKDLIKEAITVIPVDHHHNISTTVITSKTAVDITTQTSVSSHGPQIVPVGEVGEVPHTTNGATASPLPALSAALKHGVQSLNVTAWVSGCPKLYGKVELNCVIEHDALSNTAMTLMWKKKSFTEGRPQEHIMTENDLLMMEDSRFSLDHQHDRYVLSIRDFRPKDCGTYECEAKAADTRASSQLLLFTCL